MKLMKDVEEADEMKKGLLGFGFRTIFLLPSFYLPA